MLLHSRSAFGAPCNSQQGTEVDVRLYRKASHLALSLRLCALVLDGTRSRHRSGRKGTESTPKLVIVRVCRRQEDHASLLGANGRCCRLVAAALKLAGRRGDDA